MEEGFFFGNYENEEIAAKVYDYHARILFGDFASLNFDISAEEDQKIVDLISRRAKQKLERAEKRRIEQDRARDKKPDSSKYRGVTFKISNQKWVAQIGFNNKKIYIGIYDTENAAAIAYNEKALSLMGENAQLNTLD